MSSVMLGIPGPSAQWGAIRGLLQASSCHKVMIENADNGHDNFNTLWLEGLNAAEAGAITHFAMLHSDVYPEANWIDTLIEGMEKSDVTLISAPIAIKDGRGIMSCGIGNPENSWSPLRRVTAKELECLPDTFDASDLGYPGHCLLHNNGCWIADLRDKRFFETDANGDLRAIFQFPKRCFRAANGAWMRQGESEDWYFSRMIHDLGIRSAITKRCKIRHRGTVDFANWGAWGEFEQDEDTREAWEKASV